MKLKLNWVFFSSFFLAALLAELYCLFVLEADLFTISGLGTVILISLYLLLDSIRGQWRQSKEKTFFYLEQLYREEAEKRDTRYTELLNIQKASYTSAKKNAARLEEKIDELILRLQSLESSNSEALHKVVTLQKKLMDGQKNALNIEVNYHKENTKTLIAAIKEEAENLNQKEKLEFILEALKELKELPSHPVKIENSDKQFEEDSFTEEWLEPATVLPRDEDFTEEEEEEWLSEELTETEELETPAQEIVPLYDDPNKSLTREEIAALFASYGQ